MVICYALKIHAVIGLLAESDCEAGGYRLAVMGISCLKVTGYELRVISFLSNGLKESTLLSTVYIRSTVCRMGFYLKKELKK